MSDSQEIRNVSDKLNVKEGINLTVDKPFGVEETETPGKEQCGSGGKRKYLCNNLSDGEETRDSPGEKPRRAENKRNSRDKNPFKCDVCGASFASGYRLRRHISAHTGVKPYQCVTCGSGFSDSGHLKQHVLIHLGIKPFTCTICNARFKTNSQWSTHLRTHTEERPYNCTECEKAFKQIGHLKTHSLTHSGQRPYKCAACEKGFIQVSNLKRHLRSHQKNVDVPLCVLSDKG